MQYYFDSGRLFLQREPEERAPILARLARIEGQVRGLRQMVENNRYCGEEIQQTQAVAAALREVSLLLIADHLEAGIERAAAMTAEGAPSEGRVKEAIGELIVLLRSALRQ